jgi:hypothetical protein
VVVYVQDSASAEKCAMFEMPEINPVDPNGEPIGLPPFSLRRPGDLGDASIALRPDLYAAAWSLAQRDHEIDKLFNAEFYQGKDI